MGHKVKVSELKLMDIFTFFEADKYPCIFINKNIYAEWSTLQHRVWAWVEYMPNQEVTLIGNMVASFPPEIIDSKVI